MKKFIAVLSFLAILPVCAFANEETIANFDSGSDPVNLGGGVFSFAAGVGNNTATNWYEPGTFHGPNGFSWTMVWTSTGGEGQYSGGGINFAPTTIDVSTYNCVSFWAYTPNANMKAEVQFKDDDAGEHAAKVKLSDYLTAGTSIWQQVIIPFDAFKRYLPTLNLAKARNIVFNFAPDSLEWDQTGKIYIDDLKFSYQHRSPTQSRIITGADKGTAFSADVPGDTLVVWDLAGSSVTTNEVNVQVSTGYACSWVAQPTLSQTVPPGSTAYFAFSIRNNGNSGDNIVFSSGTVQGSSWPVTMYMDKDKSGTFTAGDVAWANSNGILPDSTYYFLAGVCIPVDAALTSATTIQIVAKDGYGAGANDSWPTGADDDTLTSSLMAVAGGPIISVVKSTDVAKAKPGGNVAVTLTYGNSGNIAATTLIFTEVLPFNSTLAADPGAGSADSIQYYVGSAWQVGYSATATKLRWVRNTLNAGVTGQTLTYTITVR
jgi:uncharacterized repeat protein (TIGR01451 family)